MKLIKDNSSNTNTYFVKSDINVLTKELLEKLKKIAFTTKENVRFNFHSDENEKLHNMIIFQWKGKEFKVHKHNKNVEICHIIEGKHNFYIYKDDGKTLDKVILMSDEENQIIRINPMAYHLSVPVTEYVFLKAGVVVAFL